MTRHGNTSAAPEIPAPRRDHGWLRRAQRLGLVFVLAACTADGIEDPQTYDSSSASRLFTVGYQDISDIYIEELALAELALAGLDGLADMDPDLRFWVSGETVAVSHIRRPIGSFPVPEATDAESWGELTASAVETSRTISPVLAQADSEELYEAVFDGMVTQLDGFSRYAGRDEARENRASRDGFGGIGVRIRVTDDGVKVLSVMEKTPAEKSGLQVEDLITDIDGVTAIGLSQREVVRRLRGPIRTKVNLMIRRESEELNLLITLTRALVVPQTVEYRADNGIGYLRVSNFNQGTARSVRQNLKRAHKDLDDQLIGFVIDLRGNPGGLLDQGVEVADLFITDGRILSTHGRHPDSHQYFDAESDDLADGHPVVVLLDGSSASASEIVAAALQDTGRAVLIGTTTFGKGTVQQVLPLPNDGELTLTWARFHAPSGYALEARGVLPNLCTSGDVEDADDVIRRLRRGEFPLYHYSADTASDRDDPAQIAALQARCPKRDGEPEIDLQVARAILESPALYARALGEGPDSAAVEPDQLQPGMAVACGTSPSDRSTQPGSC